MNLSKYNSTAKRNILTAICNYIFAILSGIFLFYAIFGPNGQRLLAIILFIAAFAVSGFFAFKTLHNVHKAAMSIKGLVEDGEYYKAILDAIPFPVHAVDNDMNWKFMNTGFEKTIANNGIRNRNEAYGMACCNAKASICNTDECGIKQLQRGNNESYFDWMGKKMKQSTAAILNAKGEKIGYVETVTDLTTIIEQRNYSTTETKRLAGNLSKLANGDLDLDFTVEQPNENTKELYDQFALISKSLAKVKESINLMVSDAEALCDSAIEGKLDTRVDASRHSGEYKEVINGINNTLEAIVVPLNFTSAQIAKIAAGEHLEHIDNTYKGHYAKLMDNLNKVGESLSFLKQESDKLAQAGLAGNLSVRGDADKLSGNYRDIIQGVNDTLDAINNPIEKAMNVLSNMSLNDFTEKMPDGYNGRLAELALSINKVRDTFVSIESYLVKTSQGDLSGLADFKDQPRRCDKDKLRPALIAMMQSVTDLVAEANALADFASQGDLSHRGDESLFKGSYREVISGINRMIASMAEPINNAVVVLEKWTEGDLSAKVEKKYNGDFGRIANAMNKTSDSFCEILTSITEASSQVSSGSQEIASGSQNLSQGATEQASSLEELTASVTEIASQTKLNAKNATTAKDLSTTVHEEAISGNDKMKQLQTAMNGISESSANIAKIIKVIDDIAFQTNILSLNAAVEAARAGEAGKGFAVVADEVRNLADKSAKAAKETTELIEDSVKKVKVGTDIADDTASALEKIVQSIKKSVSLVTEISQASINQATSISQINKGLDQVSMVVQTNSATAEQSAAASTELSSQAESLKQMVSQFKLNDSAAPQSKAEEKPATAAPKKPAPQAKTEAAPNSAPSFKPSIDLENTGRNKYGDF